MSSRPSSHTLPLARVKPVTASITDVLPAPFGPDETEDRAWRDREADVVDGTDTALLHGHVVDLERARLDAIAHLRGGMSRSDGLSRRRSGSMA